jgi:hypothetical protein
MKRNIIRSAIFATTALAGLALPTGLLAQNENATTVSRVDLRPLNGSGAQGQATLRLSSDRRTLAIAIKASGLEPGGPHISHVHGRSEGGTPVDSTCPANSEDSDGDGFVELEEGGLKYGPILVDFMDVDPDRDGKVSFERTVRLTGAEQALPLELRHIVVHGMTVPPGPGAGTPGEVDGKNGYLVVLPVLCGEIEQAGKGRPATR